MYSTVCTKNCGVWKTFYIVQVSTGSTPFQWRVIFLCSLWCCVYKVPVLLYKVNTIWVLALTGDESGDFHTSLILKLKKIIILWLTPYTYFFLPFFLISLRRFDSGSQYRIHIFTGNGIFEHSRLCTFVHLFPCIQVVFVLHKYFKMWIPSSTV